MCVVKRKSRKGARTRGESYTQYCVAHDIGCVNIKMYPRAASTGSYTVRLDHDRRDLLEVGTGEAVLNMLSLV